VTAREIAAYLRRVAQRLPEEVRAAEAASGRELLQACIENSSGLLSSADLRRQGHPYARRHGTPALDPDTVNRQSGAFIHAWRLDGPRSAEGGLVTAVFNVDPKAAAFLESGTRLMFARGPHRKALRETAPRRSIRLKAAVQRAFRL
jgi:hypothetical protein